MRVALAALWTAVLMVTAALAADVSDADYLSDVMNQRLESQRTGGEVPWLNPSTGNGGIVIVLSTDESDPQRPCRSYRYTIVDPSAPTIIVEGNACRVAVSIWQRSEAAVSLTLAPDPAPSTPPVARADPEPTEPPPQFPPPAHKPDPDVFYASIPTPSVY